MADLLYKDEVYQIVGAAMRVYNELKSGFLEAIYQEAFEVECELSDIPMVPQAELRVHYKGRKLKKKYFCDALCFDEIVVELKVTEEPTDINMAQLMNYLKASRKIVGVLLHFGNHQELKWKRVVV
jgi:GxxExxY protein